MNAPLQYIREHAEELRAEARPSDRLGRLTDKSVEIIRASEGMKILHSKDHGGFEGHPNDFFDWVVEVGRHHPSAGWVAGVVGIHPWELGIWGPQAEDDVYGAKGEKADDWVSSPYAPFGRLVPTEGGYRFTGRWPFATGSDHVEWSILGGMIAGDDGEALMPPTVVHVLVPMTDIKIIPESWNVMGLAGTGSNDITVDAFVPEHRVLVADDVRGNVYTDRHRPDNPLFHMQFGLMFPFAISAGTFGIARGAVDAAYAHIAKRVSTQGTASKTDPFTMEALARAESDVEAGIAHLRQLVATHFDRVSEGRGHISIEDRLRFRIDQVRATDRAVTAVGDLYRLMGSSAIQQASPLEPYWRDLQVAASHVCNVREICYTAWGAHQFGGQVPPSALY